MNRHRQQAGLNQKVETCPGQFASVAAQRGIPAILKKL